MILNEKGILKEFDIVVYPVPVVVAIGDVYKKVNAAYSPLDKDCDVIGQPEKEFGATTYHVRNKETTQFCLLVWFPDIDKCRGSFFAHEAGHISLEIFKYVEAYMDYVNQEPFCYLLGNVFRLINATFYEYKEYLENKKSKKKK